MLTDALERGVEGELMFRTHGQLQGQQVDVAGVVGVVSLEANVEELSSVVASMPRNMGLSFVLLPRASRADATELVQLVAKRTGLRSEAAVDGLSLAPSRAYVVLPSQDASVRQGRLYIRPHRAEMARADRFLRSLATDQRERAIGVLLGDGQLDGGDGLRAIRTMGGCSLRVGGRREDNGGGSADAELASGMNVPAHVLEHIAGLQRGAISEQTELPFLSRPFPGEADSLLTTLRGALSELRARASLPQHLRLWVPTCGTGEDAYALAMLAHETSSQHGALRLQIFGTDLDEEATGLARSGRYDPAVVAGASPEWQVRYFTRDGNYFRVVEPLREMCVFSRHDFMSDPPFSRIDLLVGSELLRSTTSERRESVVIGLHFALRAGGLLCVREGEQDLVPHELFERRAPGVFRARPTARRINASWFVKANDDQAGQTSRTPSAQLLTDVRARPGRVGLSLRAHAGLLIQKDGLNEGLEALRASEQELGAVNQELQSLRAQRVRELDQLDRAHADLENFVDATAVLAIICDQDLIIQRQTRAACEAFSLAEAERGTALDRVTSRLPGGAALLTAAQEVLWSGKPLELGAQLEEESGQSFLIRVLPYRTHEERVDGVVIVLTDVTALEAAKRRALAREHEQAIVAGLGLLALGSASLEQLFEQALAAVEETLGTPLGLVLERQAGQSLRLVAARGVAVEGLGRFVIEPDPGSPCADALAGNQPVVVDGLGVDPRLLDQNAKFLAGVRGIVCPMRDDGAAYGILVASASESRAYTVEDQTFVRAVANVLAGAIGRHRARRRLTLEHGVSQVLADSCELDAMARGIAPVVRQALDVDNLEFWVPEDVEAEQLTRVFSDEPSVGRARADDALLYAVFSRGVPECKADDLESRNEIGFPVLLGRQCIGVLRGSGPRPLRIDNELLGGLARVGSAVGEFMHRLRIAEALRQSEQRYRAQSAELESIYASLPVGVALYDREVRLLRVNRRLTELGGSPLELGEDGTRPSPGELLGTVAMRQVIETGEPVRDIELATGSAEQRRYWLYSLAPVKDSGGSVTALSAVVQDITDFKRAEGALREAARQKDEFLAMLGHELRNPLAAMRNATELLALSLHQGAGLPSIHGVLDRQTTQMAKLIDGLLDVSRIVRGKMSLDKTMVDLIALIHEVAQDRSTDMRRRRLGLELELATELWVEGDRVRLVQVFDNLLSNAIKFTQEGGQICIGAAQSGEFAELWVKDNGPGIEAELLPHIFEPFRQGRQTIDRSMGGLGLGLALTKGLVELHGGTVTVSSHGPGMGTRVQVQFKLLSHVGVAVNQGPSKAPAFRILVVEDNADMAEMFAQLLVANGHEVSTAVSGVEALERVRLVQPEVILCDIGLPGALSGLDVARAVRADRALAQVGLIAITGYGRPEDQRQAEAAGFDAFLVKPVQGDKLERQLTELALRRAG